MDDPREWNSGCRICAGTGIQLPEYEEWGCTGCGGDGEDWVQDAIPDDDYREQVKKAIREQQGMVSCMEQGGCI